MPVLSATDRPYICVLCRRNIDEVYPVNLLWFGNNLYGGYVRICLTLNPPKITLLYRLLSVRDVE